MRRYSAVLVAVLVSVGFSFGLNKSVSYTSLNTTPSWRPLFPNSTVPHQSVTDVSSSTRDTLQSTTTDGLRFTSTSLTLASHDWLSIIRAAKKTRSLPALSPNGGSTSDEIAATRNQRSKSAEAEGAASSSKAGPHMTTASKQDSNSRQDWQSSVSLESITRTPARKSAQLTPTSSLFMTFPHKTSSAEEATSTLSALATRTMSTIKSTQSSVSKAFDASFTQPYSVSFQGSTIHYTRATFSDLASITAVTTITTPIVESSHDDSKSTSIIGIIIVGPGGTWWNGGIGGLQLHGLPCIWPFCPPKGRDNKPSNDKSNEEDGGEQEQQSRSRNRPTTPTTNSIPSSTSDPCSRTMTASDCSVYCESHSTSSTSQSCSTTCFSTVTGCSVSGVTTTTTQSPTPSMKMCSPSCSNCKEGGILVPRISVGVHKRVLPTPSSSPAGITVFMQDQTGGANRVPLGSYGGSTALCEPLLDARVDMAVTGLYGCTSVVVVSKKGIYMSHLWETPSFAPYDIPTFDKQVLQALKYGDGPSMPGLLALMQSGGILAASSEPSTFIITPKLSTPWDPSKAPTLKYRRQVERIRVLLKSFIYTIAEQVEQVEPQILTYIPASPNAPYRNNRVSGKILVQYDPLQPLPPSTATTGCAAPRQQPMLRLWVAASPKPAFEKTWVALPNQLGPQKRRLPQDTCGLRGPKTTVIENSRGSLHDIATRTSASATIASTRPPRPHLPSINSASPAGIKSSESPSVVHRTSTVTVIPLPESAVTTSASVVHITSTITVIPLPESAATTSASIVHITSTVTVVPIPFSSFRTSHRTSTVTVIPLPFSTATTGLGN